MPDEDCPFEDFLVELVVEVVVFVITTPPSLCWVVVLTTVGMVRYFPSSRSLSFRPFTNSKHADPDLLVRGKRLIESGLTANNKASPR